MRIACSCSLGQEDGKWIDTASFRGWGTIENKTMSDWSKHMPRTRATVSSPACTCPVPTTLRQELGRGVKRGRRDPRTSKPRAMCSNDISGLRQPGGMQDSRVSPSSISRTSRANQRKAAHTAYIGCQKFPADPKTSRSSHSCSFQLAKTLPQTNLHW